MALTDQTWTRSVMQSIMQGIVFYEYHRRVVVNSVRSSHQPDRTMYEFTRNIHEL